MGMEEVIDGVKAEQPDWEQAAAERSDASAEHQSLAMSRSMYGKPQGMAASGYGRQVADGIDKANEQIRERYYKNNPKGYAHYLSTVKASQAMSIAAALDHECAQLVHAEQKNRLAAAENEGTALGEEFANCLNGSKLREAADFELAKSEYNDRMDTISVTATGIGPGDEMSPSGEGGLGIGKELAAKLAESAKDDYAKAVETAARRNSETVSGLVELTGQRLDDFYQEQVKTGRRLGWGDAKCAQFAIAQTRRAAKKILGHLVESDNHEGAEAILKHLRRPGATARLATDRDGNLVKDNDGNTVVVHDNFLGRWCLSADDVSDADRALVMNQKRAAAAAKLRQQEAEAEYKGKMATIGTNLELVRAKYLTSSEDPTDACQQLIDEIMKTDAEYNGAFREETEKAVKEVTSFMTVLPKFRDDMKKEVAAVKQGQWKEVIDGFLDRNRQTAVANVDAEWFGTAFDSDGNMVTVTKGGRDFKMAMDVYQVAVLRSALRTGVYNETERKLINDEIRSLEKGIVAKDIQVTKDIFNELPFRRPQNGVGQRADRSGALVEFETFSNQGSEDVMFGDGYGLSGGLRMSGAYNSYVEYRGKRLYKAEVDAVVGELYDLVNSESVDLTSKDGLPRRREIVGIITKRLDDLVAKKSEREVLGGLIDVIRATKVGRARDRDFVTRNIAVSFDERYDRAKGDAVAVARSVEAAKEAAKKKASESVK